MDQLDDPFTHVAASTSRRTSDAYSSPSSSVASATSNPPSHATILADPFTAKDGATPGTTATGSKPGTADVLFGQFSSTPAIQTTVVTTTTTTTTSFPPLMMKAPRHLHNLDPDMYPLAASPTPPSLRKIRFDVDGQASIFTEAEDAAESYQEFENQHKRLRSANGSIRAVSQFQSNAMSKTFPSLQTSSPQSMHQQSGEEYKSSEKEPKPSLRVNMTPPSSGQAKTRRQKMEQQQQQQQQQRSMQTSAGSSKAGQPFLRSSRSSSRLQFVQTSTPITPMADPRASNSSRGLDGPRATRNMAPLSREDTERASPSHEVSQTLSPQPESSFEPTADAGEGSPTDDHPLRETSLSTPPVEASLRRNTPSTSTQRPRPSALDVAAAQDASLPSPSLSPVTAAATLHSRRGYFDDSSRSDVRNDHGIQRTAHGLGLWSEDPSRMPKTMSAEEWDDSGNRNFSMMEIPRMLDAFEVLPTEMKSYVMYQFLRRCPKSVLHSIADAVNPALKCDFLSLLPLELSQIIIGHLDVKSLCRAAQVSRKWRQIVDSDEKTWKNLFDTEGFALAPGELRRAILEGWGWQHTATLAGSEMDLGSFIGTADAASPAPSGVITLSSSPAADDRVGDAQSVQNRRPKRKAAVKARQASRKVPKRKEVPSYELALYDTDALSHHLETSEGPFAAARAAKIAVPASELGLSSLRSLKLYKSIYRRHHLISRNWMQDEVKPRHLAFHAHSRHVVTCLEFDSDKILTGSDDTNINVYDTRTGALRARLTGHEGGVWALKYEGNMLVSGSTDRSVRVWDIEKGMCVHVFHGHTSTVRCLVIVKPAVIGKSTDGTPIMMPKEPLIITGSRDSTLRVWTLPKQGDEPTGLTLSTNTTVNDIESPYFVRQLIGHAHSVRAIAAHGDTLVSGSYDSSVRVWKISTGELIHRLMGHNQKVYSVVLDHERNRCISGSMDTLVKIWDLETGNVLYDLDGHTSLVGLLDLQRERLVSAAADSTLRIWDPSNGKNQAILSAHTGAITCFQHDGHKVISGSDRNLKMWDIKTGQFVRDLLRDLSGVWQVKFDERRCVAAVQRHNLTFIEILDFGASRDGMAASHRGKRVVVDTHGVEITEPRELDEQADAEA